MAAVIGGLGGAAIYAATQGQSAHHRRRTRDGRRSGAWTATTSCTGGPPPSPAQPVPTGALHSEYVVSDGHGGYTTKLTQTGTVDEVTPVVGRRQERRRVHPDLRASARRGRARTSSVAANDTVTVAATRTGSTVTLTSIGNGPPHGN